MIKRFREEVLDLGAEACLPSNLSDEWIDYLDQELMTLDLTDTGEEPDVTCSLAAVVTILMFQKKSKNTYSATVDKVFDRLLDFKIEIGLEVVRRRTEIKYEPATIKTIFTNRTVRIKKMMLDDM